jgi:hypothetical protein
MAAADKLRSLERHVGVQKPARRQSKRCYDPAGPIVLSYSQEQYAPPGWPPPQAWPKVKSYAAAETSAPSSAWVQPPASHPQPPIQLAPAQPRAWCDLATRPRALQQPPGFERQPHFTEADDEAAASSFAADVAQLPFAEAESVLPTSADAGEFLARATAEAPKPQTQPPLQQQEDPSAEPLPEEEEPEGWRHGHDIFDRMTAYANQFDLGPVALDLDRAFDAFDRSLEAEVAAKQARAPVSPQPSAHELARDLDLIRNEIAYPVAQAASAGQAEETSAGPQSFSVVYDVPLVPQQTGYSCWAAGAAMLVAWRDKMSVDPSAIAAATGYWEQYKHGLQAEDTTMFHAWGLVPETAQTYSVDQFRALLERWGPLWVASAEPGPHIRVAAGIEGDGSASGTRLHIRDPWEPGMQEFRLPNAGGSYTETYAEFEAKQASLARTELNVQGIYVAHIAQERPR